jgi:hypothetical protein
MLGCKKLETSLADHQTVNMVISNKYRIKHGCQITNYMLLIKLNFMSGDTFFNLPLSYVNCVPWGWDLRNEKCRSDKMLIEV